MPKLPGLSPLQPPIPGPRARGLLLALTLLAGCSRPVDRPLEGARPRSSELSTDIVAAPPTLSSAQPAPSVSPSPLALAITPSPQPAASPSPPPGRNPIISGLQPARDAVVPPGAVTISARISGASDLTQATLSLNGAPLEASITRQDARTWLVSHAGRLAAGTYQARVVGTDQDGRAGGFRWQFQVAADPAASPTPARR